MIDTEVISLINKKLEMDSKRAQPFPLKFVLQAALIMECSEQVVVAANDLHYLNRNWHSGNTDSFNTVEKKYKQRFVDSVVDGIVTSIRALYRLSNENCKSKNA